MASSDQIEQLVSGDGISIAGYGSDTPIRDIDRLVATYGGSSGDWAKVRSRSFEGRDGWSFETHAYRNLVTGETVEIKTKIEGHN